jgi:indolepyruvate ferredoxin oxidoreductase beta subunit
MPSELNCLIAGVGGQGSIFAARVLALAAMNSGFEVRGSETIGMAQRGGGVVSHIRCGRNINSPLIPQGRADVIIALEPGEGVRSAKLLKSGGLIVTSDKTIIPSSGKYQSDAVFSWLRQSFSNLVILHTDIIMRECGGRSINSALLGAAAQAQAFPFGVKALEAALEEYVRPKLLKVNLRSLRMGAEQMKEGCN